MYNYRKLSDTMNFLIVVAMVFVGVFIQRSCTEYLSANTNRQLGALEQSNAQMVQNNKEAKVSVEVAEMIGATQLEAIADIAVKEKEVIKTVKKRVEDTAKKTQVVESSPGLTPEEKDIKIAEIQITSLWDSYCGVPGSSCQNKT